VRRDVDPGDVLGDRLHVPERAHLREFGHPLDGVEPPAPHLGVEEGVDLHEMVVVHDVAM